MTRPAFLIGMAAFFILLAFLVARPNQETIVPPPRPNPFQDPKAGVAHVRQLARQYGDQFDRLPDDDKLMLNSIALGHGRELLAKYAREEQTKTGQKKAEVNATTAENVGPSVSEEKLAGNSGKK